MKRKPTAPKVNFPYTNIFICLSFFLMPFIGFSQSEICDNGIDDDGDGLIDLNDDECFCEIVEPVSLIPNPSFEDQDCCPNARSQLNCASNWIQASEPTTDYIHTCDWLGWDNFPPPMPFPDGDGIMGFRDGRVRNNSNEPEPFWKEYAGACLLSPLLKDSTYRFEFDVGFVDHERSPPIDISFFGTASCDYLPFGIGNSAFGCPTNDINWKKLDEVNVSGQNGNIWVNTFIEFTAAEDIYAIAIGPDCSPVSSQVSIYYFFDNLLLTDLSSFDLVISESLHPCNPDFSLSVPNNSSFNYQWFKEGVALVSETSSALSANYGEGSYQVQIIDGLQCKLSANFIVEVPEFEAPSFISICDGDVYNFGELQITEPGFYLDTFQNVNLCDSIVPLQLIVLGSTFDTIEMSIFEGETLEIQEYSFTEEGNYDLILESAIGCDSLVYLQLTDFGVFIPNVFSPDNDGSNEVFEPLAQNGRILSYQSQIYDRWGNLIFEGGAWRGRNNQPGVYIYAMNIDFEDGTNKTFFGSITLIQ